MFPVCFQNYFKKYSLTHYLCLERLTTKRNLSIADVGGNLISKEKSSSGLQSYIYTFFFIEIVEALVQGPFHFAEMD